MPDDQEMIDRIERFAGRGGVPRDSELDERISGIAQGSQIRLDPDAQKDRVLGPKPPEFPSLPQGFDPASFLGKPFVPINDAIGWLYVPLEMQVDKRRRPEYRVRRFMRGAEDDCTILAKDFVAQMKETKDEKFVQIANEQYAEFKTAKDADEKERKRK
jgi:hypothetical protein